MSNSGGNGQRRPIVQNGVIHWVPANDPRVGRGHVPFGGTGQRLSNPPPSAPLPGGPLSQPNIDFLRNLSERRSRPQFVGLRHTTDAVDRASAARSGNVDRPGFEGDAYSMVPPMNRQRPGGSNPTGDPRRDRLAADMFQRLTGRPAPRSSTGGGGDQDFNRAVNAGIENSLQWDIARAAAARTSVGDVAQHLEGNTQFALADMGGAPRSGEHDRYGASTAKFGRRRVPPENVFADVGAEPQQLARAARERGLSLSSPIGQENAPQLAAALAPVYGREVNRAIDRERRLEALRTEDPNDRRARIAAAAELRMLQAQGRGRPSVRQQTQARVAQLEQTVRREPQ